MNLKKKIKQELLNEQFSIGNYDCHHFVLCDQPLYQGQHVLTPFVPNAWPGWPATNNVGYGQYFSQASTNFWNAVGSPSQFEVVKVNATANSMGSPTQTSDLCWKYIGNYACYNGGTFYWDSVNSVSPIINAGPNSCTDCANLASPVMGCTDSQALNYDPSATQDDGSCDYGFICESTWFIMTGRRDKNIGKECIPGNSQNPGTFGTLQDCESDCGPRRAPGDKNKTIQPFAPDLQSKKGIEVDGNDLDLEKEPIRKKIKEELENFDDTIGQVEFQDELVTLSSSERAQLRDMLEDVMDDKRKLEEVFDYKGIPELKAQGVFGKMFKWLKRYLTDKATTYLINASAEETKDTIELIKVMDPNDMTGIFDPKAIYLGGAIDFAKDALGWRTQMEEYFGENHVVKDERMTKLVLTGEWDTKGISVPAILNPLRAETVREEDDEFNDLFGKWKKDSLTDDEMQTFREKIRQNIILQDLRMLDICDTNLLRYDGKAGAGTLGEAQISALKNQQIFLWVTDGMKISNVSPWLLPAVTKICVDDEIWELLKHFK